ncbi:MAG TPA: hypothetical protein VM533_17685 [Fimbriiglobus sp.]|jgi:hypothetical protein|nr:hypothetical protein [Fimbriiglobus sp.]
MTRTLALAALLALAGPAAAQDAPTVKVADTPPPKELAEPVRALLDSKAMTVSDAKGKALLTVWPRKSLSMKASDPGYTGLEESTVLGAVQFPEVWKDYRRQNIKPGVYTLRLGLQPMDGDHMGTAPYNEFALLTPADKDVKPDILEPKALQEHSKASTTRKHPGLVLLFPNPKPGDKPEIEGKPQEHFVLSYKQPVKAGGKDAGLGVSLVVVGFSMAE